jgi:hypothetical protein
MMKERNSINLRPKEKTIVLVGLERIFGPNCWSIGEQTKDIRSAPTPISKIETQVKEAIYTRRMCQRQYPY